MSSISDSVAEQANEIIAQIGADNIDRITFVGHSLGQYVGLYTLLNRDITIPVTGLIGMGGVARGVRGENPLGKLNSIINTVLSPAMVEVNNLEIVDAMLLEHQQEISSLNKCLSLIHI